ncbi:MAG: NAD+ synthase, similar to eukaryotic protein [uncultured bacterium]|nr:MAG: NAD+ synthase, similar to eukaryotic protein [uncultured bacterium]
MQFRLKRAFDPHFYLTKKIELLIDYMRFFKLNACIVPVSGGIDSAVTLGIISKAAQIQNSPIKRIVAALLPVFKTEGATNQKMALSHGKTVAKHFGIKPVIIDLSLSFAQMKKTVDGALDISGEAWAAGQLVSYLRTPALYYLTSLLNQDGLSPLLCGTLNRDEGAYLGFFGKASDGMVDLQLISDLHKSEVYQMAKVLKIPVPIIRAIPSGDMFDGRTDEEVFGAPYDFVELYLHYLCAENDNKKQNIQKNWTRDSKDQFRELSLRLDRLHHYNRHKYLGESPAIHLDVYTRKVPIAPSPFGSCA